MRFLSQKRLLFVPAIALAITALGAPIAGAQAADPIAELQQISRDNHAMDRAYDKLDRQIKHCQAPDATEVERVLAAANDVSRRAGAVAWQLGGTRHVRALGIQTQAETDYWLLKSAQFPDVCYQPPA